MRVAFHDNDGKGALVRAALEGAGRTIVADHGDVAVIDHPHTNTLADRHPAVLYPHGGNVCLDWDGHLPMHPNVSVILTHGPGHGEVLAAYGCPVPTVPVGWCYSETAPPRYPAKVERVLFVAAHASGSGYLPEGLARAGREALTAACELFPAVHVRVPGQRRGLTHADIDAADLVIADNGTVAHLALARGVPLVMYGTRTAPDLGHDAPHFPAQWNHYRHLMAYPFDTADAPLGALVEQVCRRSPGVDEYRRRMVGGPFCPERVVAFVEAVAAGKAAACAS